MHGGKILLSLSTNSKQLTPSDITAVAAVLDVPNQVRSWLGYWI